MNQFEAEMISCSQWGMFNAADDDCACDRAQRRRKFGSSADGSTYTLTEQEFREIYPKDQSSAPVDSPPGEAKQQDSAALDPKNEFWTNFHRLDFGYLP